MRYSKARELISKCIEADSSVNIYHVAGAILVDVKEVKFMDDTLFTCCGTTRTIEVSKDLPNTTKERIVAQCLSNFV